MRTQRRISWLMCVLLLGCGKSGPQPQPATAAPTLTSQGTEEIASEWPFKEPPDLAVLSLTRIVKGSKPILYVVHDVDGDWQFLDGDDVSEEDAATVSLKQVVELDSSLKALADLPKGWGAERGAIGKPWTRLER